MLLVGETRFPCPPLMLWPRAGNQHLPSILVLVSWQALLGSGLPIQGLRLVGLETGCKHRKEKRCHPETPALQLDAQHLANPCHSAVVTTVRLSNCCTALRCTRETQGKSSPRGDREKQEESN